MIKTKRQKPTVAFMYDFDGTLSPGNMQEYGFMAALGEDRNTFWQKSNDMAKENEMDPIAAYMYLMVQESGKKPMVINKEQMKVFGKSVEFFKGVTTWFERINAYTERQGLLAEHYIISSGIKEFIEGTPIAKEFKKIFASSFIYDAYGKPVWPAQIVNFTTKTQYIFRINKGALEIPDDVKVNQYVPEEERPIPFRRMIYIGDGDTDIPCMKLVKASGGHSIAVYSPNRSKKKANELLGDNRCSYIAPADYSEGKSLEVFTKRIIDLIAAQENLNKLK